MFFNVGEGIRELLIVGLVVAAAVGVHAYLQGRLSKRFSGQNEVAGYIFSAVGVIYAVLLGFVVVVVWEKYDTTVSNVDQEIASVSDLYRVAAGLPPKTEAAVRLDLRRYVADMIDVEWPQMAQRVIVAADLDVIESMAHAIATVKPADLGESNAQLRAMGQSARLFDARRERLIESAPSVPVVLWFALYTGAVAMLFFCYLFGVENRPTQLIMTAVLAALIGILFTVIDEFDSPFSGSVSISDAGWKILAVHLPQIP
ncbi:MAG TPA: DUF4239 domain-containing protein [Candidatus Acidoferrales bacterium]|nr:DUF4239 domain-containing protein [Candidatus Acidoferrales bacterium]